MTKLRPFIGPVEQKCVNFGVDTFLVNFKMAGPDGKPNGDTLPEEVAARLESWQEGAKKEHKPVPTPLLYRGATLFIRPHGDGVFSWLLFNNDVTLAFSYGSLHGSVFCQVRFLSHLLWSIGPENALVDMQAMLYDMVNAHLATSEQTERHMIHAQASEIHICADMQGWYDLMDGSLAWNEAFVTRVTTIRARPDDLPDEREQQGGLSPKEIKQLNEKIRASDMRATPMVTTTHRRIATLDFGSHGSNIMGQIYNKSEEIKKSKKRFFEPIWRANGWDGLSVIFRIEIRFKRDALASFDLNDAYEVLARINQLWQYATYEWLRYVDLSATEDTNKSRLPAHCMWECVQAACSLGEDLDQRDKAGEQEARLTDLLDERPHEVIAEMAICNETAYQQPDEQDAHDPTEEKAVIADSLKDEPPDVVREIALDLLETLTPEQIRRVVARLSPEPFQDVQARLIKRSRRMAKKQACIASFAGYLTSIMALSMFDGPEYSMVDKDRYAQGTPHHTGYQPDLRASLRIAFEEVKKYNKERGRVHVEEVWKKRLAYGFITAQQLEEERRNHGVDLSDEDIAAWEKALLQFQRKEPDISLRSFGFGNDEGDIA